MSFPSKDSQLLAQQLKVQELVVRYADSGLHSDSTVFVTVDLVEPVSIVSCLHIDNSGPSALVIEAAKCVVQVDGHTVIFELGAAFASNDSLQIKYIVLE